MPTYIPPKKNVAWVGYVALTSQANTKKFQVNPTIAAGDFQVSIDGAAFGNLTTLPTVTPAGGVWVKISLSTAEMNGDNILIQAIDAAGDEWCDFAFELKTAARHSDDLAYPATTGRSLDVDASGAVAAILEASSVADVWAALTASMSGAGTVGKLLADTLDAAISSRTTSAAAATAVWGAVARTLTAGVDVTSVNGSTAAAVRLALANAGIHWGTVETDDFAPTTTIFEASIAGVAVEATANHYVNRPGIFITGALAGQAFVVSAYSAPITLGRYTTSARTEAPADGDQFLLF